MDGRQLCAAPSAASHGQRLGVLQHWDKELRLRGLHATVATWLHACLAKQEGRPTPPLKFRRAC